MTARPWMPFYFSDYLADTAHLSVSEHGAYLLLIAHYWAHGGLPAEEATIARITRMSARQWSQSRDILRSLFGDVWRHKRIDHELAKAIEKSKKNSANAKLSHSDRRPNAKRTPTQLQSQPHKEDSALGAEPKPSRKKPATTIPDDWKPSDEDFQHGRDIGLTDAETTREASKFRNHAKQNDRRAVNWHFAFRNWCINAAEFLGRKPKSTHPSQVRYRADPHSAEFLAWKAHARDAGNRAFTRILDQRELEGRAFEFESQWPPGHKVAA